MNNYIFWGITVLIITALLGVLGTYLMYRGTTINSTKDKGDIIDTIEKKSNPTVSNLIEQNNIGNLNVSDNTGPTQVNIGSTNNSQVVNQRRYFLKEFKVNKEIRDSLHILKLTFYQTDGIWDSGTTFILDIKLSGPYTGFKFLSGLTGNWQNVRITLKPEDRQKGIFYFSTTTAPERGNVILEITSKDDIDVVVAGFAPQASSI
ncbi:MAG: hypothetical protein A2538_02210 [Candidatus Magasanikbacteria bacterium RIFOXYD2_FULL_41_14]|uniref:Uncharacterized protein n=1 Tax=Candidatus Magasanikbacteria bacterium RIFOXYD2_FULL_41_14 TaxID=1798709 RepID=A0A1F6PD95_9BACT|nr:MAG: hypothetical protein A2538_02210 [Candidatus Magasanikbacteria bacterium RIFOXYD2_FULL_41_14]